MVTEEEHKLLKVSTEERRGSRATRRRVSIGYRMNCRGEPKELSVEFGFHPSSIKK